MLFKEKLKFHNFLPCLPYPFGYVVTWPFGHIATRPPEYSRVSALCPDQLSLASLQSRASLPALGFTQVARLRRIKKWLIQRVGFASFALQKKG